MKHTYFFIIFTSFLIPTVVAAQVTLVAPLQMVARSGDSVTVELKAKTRDTLSTLQFTLVWNPAVLTFGRVDTLGGLPPSSEPSELGLTNISQGKLSFVWLTNSLAGFRVADSISIFKVVFKAVGANGTSSALQFQGAPTPIRASNGRLVGIAVTTQNGEVKIGTTSIQNALNTEGVLQLEQNTPNPFREQTTIRFNMTEADDVVFEVFDFQGRRVFEKRAFYSIGNHDLRLDTEGGTLGSKGIYVYRLRTAHGAVSRKRMIKI